jgi:hypothetical protein
MLATDQVSGGPGVDARFWLAFGPVIDGTELGATTPPLLMALPNVSPPDDPLGYWTRGCYGFPLEAAMPGADGLWVHVGRLGPDGSVTSEHVAVKETSVQLSGGSCGG